MLVSALIVGSILFALGGVFYVTDFSNGLQNRVDATKEWTLPRALGIQTYAVLNLFVVLALAAVIVRSR